jgi:hypothetical protein
MEGFGSLPVLGGWGGSKDVVMVVAVRAVVNNKDKKQSHTTHRSPMVSIGSSARLAKEVEGMQGQACRPEEVQPEMQEEK